MPSASIPLSSAVPSPIRARIVNTQQLLLQIAYRLSQCAWLSSSQRHSFESYIRTLSDMARSRSIAIPSYLDNQVTSLNNKPALHLGANEASKIFCSSRLQSTLRSRES
ncbi:hypothetical protein DAPPUDRAFT_252650 [Daphnia pulex]|uniref:Uncharacterized protein n=1 Tax=Daphnia pulex TaxID=6669 RepID=E9H369_DAPPU|nr:hypothetical protein DAPPUDRAFT_252650 [Daphnia pulex]|eukprot:EFX73707.1 hypothetical protein DAPPUDRAFT_252650 [Daphnia pulex]